MKNQSVLLFGLLSLVITASCSTESHIKHYSGEGKINARPSYGFWGGGGGYIVQFDPIKLDRPTHITYHFAGLPHWTAGIYFAVEDTRIWKNRQQYELHERRSLAGEPDKTAAACRDDLSGRCSMVLKDADDNVVLQYSKKLSDLTWSRAGQGPWELYDQKAVHFRPDSRKYSLEITIDPDPQLKDDKGYVLIRGGGHEPVPIGL